MVFSFLKNERRQELLECPFPEQWLPYLDNSCFLYRLLSPEEQARLRDITKILIAEKFWEGCNGLSMTDEIKVTIAGQASLLLLGFDDYYFDELKTILVYPGGYLAPVRLAEGENCYSHRLGEAHAKGPVVLSWWHTRWDARQLGTHNLVLHEFAHKLAELGDPQTGTPPMEDELAESWEAVMQHEFARLVEDTGFARATVLDAYGARNRVEFFAVATECFFLRPVLLQRRHPDLYALLAEWYRQSPAEHPWTAADRALARSAEVEYCQHVVEECTAFLRHSPQDPGACERRAEAYRDLEKWDEAIADYTSLIQLDFGDFQAYGGRALVYLDKGLVNEALADLDRAIALRPELDWLHRVRARALAKKGDFEKALASLDRASRLNPRDDEHYNQRGLLYCQMGEYAKAMGDFSQAIKLYPHGAEALRNRARVFLASKAFEQATADCTRAIWLEPEDLEGYHIRASAYLEQRQFDAAIADCNRAIELDSEDLAAQRIRAEAHAALSRPMEPPGPTRSAEG
jgi:MtfA peptidase